MVVTERLISEEAEYRVFADDSSSETKIRIGAAYNPYLEHNLSSSKQLGRDENEFLWQGFQDIRMLLDRVFEKQEGRHTSIENEAKELFQKAFKGQREEKQNGRSNDKQSNAIKNKTTSKRQRYSKRHQFVVATIYHALKIHKLGREVDDLAALLGTKAKVSRRSVKKCLKALNKY